MNVKEILTRTPPAILYHYTTQAGLLGIINGREIWATHTQYLNDLREFRHAIGIVRDELETLRSLPENRKLPGMFDAMEEELKDIERINVCVASFSERGDMLSQWRAYGGGSGGFSLGFSGALLQSILGDTFWLVPCLYDEAEQRTLIRTLLEDVLAENKANPSVNRPAGNLVAYLNRYAPILKHQSFTEEREWRIVSRPLNCESERFCYRPGASMLVPYYRLPLYTARSDFSIEEIIVGPTPHPQQSVHSVTSLLVKYDMRKTRVVPSDTPYRNW